MSETERNSNINKINTTGSATEPNRLVNVPVGPSCCCSTCSFWQRDDHKGTLVEAPWGYCWVGFDPALRLPNRTTTDLSWCSHHQLKS